jgi:hypothetical protein
MQPSVQALSAFKHLSMMQLQLFPFLGVKGYDQILVEKTSKCINAARGVLEQISSPGKKLIKLVHIHGREGPGRLEKIQATKVELIEIE